MARWKKIRLNWDDVLEGAGLMRKERSHGAGTFLFGVGIGLIGGAAAALLLTPFSGSESRGKILRAGEDIGRTVSNKVNELASGMRGEVKSSLHSGGGAAYSSGNRLGST